MFSRIKVIILFAGIINFTYLLRLSQQMSLIYCYKIFLFKRFNILLMLYTHTPLVLQLATNSSLEGTPLLMIVHGLFGMQVYRVLGGRVFIILSLPYPLTTILQLVILLSSCLFRDHPLCLAFLQYREYAREGGKSSCMLYKCQSQLLYSYMKPIYTFIVRFWVVGAM